MDSKTFWALVNNKRDILIEQHKERVGKYSASGNDPVHLEGQPLDGKVLWVVSKENPFTCTTQGRVAEATYRLAAQRIIEGSHEVATAEQIAAHLREREEEFARLQALPARRNSSPGVIIAPLQPRPRPAEK